MELAVLCDCDVGCFIMTRNKVYEYATGNDMLTLMMKYHDFAGERESFIHTNVRKRAGLYAHSFLVIALY